MMSGDFTLRILDRLDAIEGKVEELESRLAEIKPASTRADDEFPTEAERQTVRAKVTDMVDNELARRRELIREARAGSMAAAAVLRAKYNLKLIRPSEQ